MAAEKVFGFFKNICDIPHGSGNTKAIAKFCADFAKERGLECFLDKFNNVTIFKEATPGFEDVEPIILQAHIDMVCAKEPGSPHDFLKDPIKVLRDGEYIHADGTTLGADDGIGAAAMLALLDDNTLEHPRLEAIFTTDEETGMTGAIGLDVSKLKGRRMLNLDSEEEGIFIAGCAGGEGLRCTYDAQPRKYVLPTVKVMLGGFEGGHSGEMIHLGRANAIMVLGRVLNEIRKDVDIHLISINGGVVSNGIPDSAEAEFACSPEKVPRCTDIIRDTIATVKAEYEFTDPRIFANCKLDNRKERLALSIKDTNAIIYALTALPDGVQYMEPRIPGMVQTSLNLGIIRCDKGAVTFDFLIRSSVQSRKELIHDKVAAVFDQIGAYVEILDSYPAWEYKAESKFREEVIRTYESLFKKRAEVKVLHAGLECGILAEKIPGLDVVSLGPDMQDIHTPKERLSIPSTDRFYRLIREVITKK